MNNVLFVRRRIRDIHKRTRSITSPNAAGRTFAVPSLSVRDKAKSRYSQCRLSRPKQTLVLFALLGFLLDAVLGPHGIQLHAPRTFFSPRQEQGYMRRAIHLFRPLLRLKTSSLLRRISAVVPRLLSCKCGGCSACSFGPPRPCSRSRSRPCPCPRVLVWCRRRRFQLVSRLRVLLRSLRIALTVRLRLGFGLKRRCRPARAQKLRRVFILV